jgi:hypothetical protein
MRANTRPEVISIAVIVFVITIAVAAAIIADVESKKEIYYSEEELQVLYQEYGITENDVKFARGELPAYMNETILESGKRIIVTEDGVPPENMVEGKDYDLILSEQEMRDASKNARLAYIEEYGVDPANPKLDSVNGYLLPKQEVDRLVWMNYIEIGE